MRIHIKRKGSLREGVVKETSDEQPQVQQQSPSEIPVLTRTENNGEADDSLHSENDVRRAYTAILQARNKGYIPRQDLGGGSGFGGHHEDYTLVNGQHLRITDNQRIVDAAVNKKYNQQITDIFKFGETKWYGIVSIDRLPAQDEDKYNLFADPTKKK